MDIRAIRERCGMTQEELAEMTNVTIGYISHLETGKRTNPSVAVLRKLATALNVTVDDLFEQKAC